MTYTFWDFLQLVGSLGIFINGMKVFSDGLQKVAGNKLRAILKGMTSTRFRGNPYRLYFNNYYAILIHNNGYGGECC